MSSTPVVALAALALSSLTMAAGASGKTIVWDKSTLVQVNRGGTYPRMIRIGDGDILCSFEDTGKSWVKRSSDNGRTWSEAVIAAQCEWGAAANPELLQLANGWVLLLYNERPSDGKHPFTIQVALSRDDGRTWCHLSRAYVADTDPKNGCWEPAAIQLPSGEIQLFFANENPYRKSDEQEITLLRSFDNGRTWGKPKTVSFRAGHRDGMPVPLVLAGGKGIVVAIEDNGYGTAFQPSTVHTTMEDNWKGPCAGAASPHRWRALKRPIHASWTGAPYIRQMPSGETVLSFQSNEGREKPRMVVYVGDENARGFGGASVPFDVPPDEGGWWNSLFVKDDHTITAVSACNGGIWAIDGHIVGAKEE